MYDVVERFLDHLDKRHQEWQLVLGYLAFLSGKLFFILLLSIDSNLSHRLENFDHSLGGCVHDFDE